MSLQLEDVLQIIKDHLADQPTVQAIAKDLIAAEKETKEAKADHSAPKSKTRLIALVRQDPGSQMVGGAYIISAPDTDDVTSETYHGEALLNRLRAAAKAHDEQPRKRRSKGKPVKIETWRDLFAHVKAKTVKASGSAIGFKQKGQPVEVVVLSSEGIAPQ